MSGNTGHMFAAFEAAGLDPDQRKDAAFFMLGYLAPSIDPDEWRRAVEHAVEHNSPSGSVVA